MEEVARWGKMIEMEESKFPPFQCAIGMGMHAVNVFSEKEDFVCYFEGKGTSYIPRQSAF